MAGSNRHGTGRSGGGNDGHALKFVLNSELVAPREPQKLIMDQVDAAKFDPHAVFAIKLSLEEALINAIKHGNKLNPSKKVYVEARVTPKLVEITIEDEGAGFDRSKIPDPTREENLELCSGRGILLIESYMDEVEYTKGGRRLRMVKRNEPAEVKPQ